MADDEIDERRRVRLEHLKKFIASLADGDDAVAKFGQAIALSMNESQSPDDKITTFMVFADAVAPGVSTAWKHLIAAVHAFSDDGFKAMLEGDPVLVAAARVVQAVLVAVERRDAEALHEWERRTLAYMLDKAPDDYATLPIPPRAGHDRHVVLGALLKRIKALLGALPPMVGVIEMTAFSMSVQAIVRAAFTNLDPAPESKNISTVINEQFPQYVEKFGRAQDIDPEAVLTDALETLGVSRKTVQQSWLKGVKD